MAMSYGHVYVASVAFGAKDSQTVQAFQEAESYDGPSLIIAYSHCIAHGYDLRFGAEQQKLAVDSGVWPLYRYDPRRVERGEPPLVIDAAARPGARRRLHAQRDALPHGGEDRPRALPPAGCGGRATTPRGGSPCTSNSPASRCRCLPARPCRSRPGGEGGRPMNLATTYLGFELPHPLMPGRLAARGRPRHGAPAGGRRRPDDRDALALRGADRARGGRRHPLDRDARRRASPRR